MQWDVQGRHDVRPVRRAPAPFDEVERLADACTRAGMPAHAVADARGPQWRKVIFNASTNPIGALTGLTHGRVCERPDLRALVTGLVDEGKAVAAAQGIELDADPEELIDHAARPDVAYDHKASMLQDVEARRQTEVDYLNGGIVRFGARARRADAAQRRDLGARERGGGIVEAELTERPARAGARGDAERDGLDAVIVCGNEYTGFEGAVTYLSGFVIVHRYAYVLLPRRGRAGDRLPERGALRRRARRRRGSTSRSSSTARASGSPTACAASASASTGSTT